jgi:inner membrane transporter RhtA
MVDRVPPVTLVIGAVASVQIGGALAKTLFDEVGPGGTVLLRTLFTAVILALLWRPEVRDRARRDWLLIGLFGFCLAGMNYAFYESLDRIPLGVAVTFEFVGPLGVAVFGSRRALDLLWVVLAAAGILLLADPNGGFDGTGVALALLAGAFWATYILVAARMGQAIPGGAGLTLAMVVACVLVFPFGLAEGGGDLLDPAVLGIGLGVAILSSAIPYSLEFEALRRLPAGVFGVLMSMEPAMAALAGFVVLGEVLGARELVAIGLVVVASAGAARGAPGTALPRD